MIKKFISVTSHGLYPLPLSQTVTPSRTPSPFERDVLYGRPLNGSTMYTKAGYQAEDRKVGIGDTHSKGSVPQEDQ